MIKKYIKKDIYLQRKDKKLLNLLTCQTIQQVNQLNLEEKIGLK